MKRFLRLVLGLVSSLLFTAGLARAASRIDPLSLTQPKSIQTQAGLAHSPCSIPCFTPDMLD